jgi:hypothetical protein
MIDTRRMLLESETRNLQASDILHSYAAGIPQAAGPIHGFVVKAAAAGILISLEQDGLIWIRTPLGAFMPVTTSHETHYKACIREACGYAAV